MSSGIGLEVVSVREGEIVVQPQDDRERVIVILSGVCEVDFPEAGRSWAGLGGRADVFDGPATAVYVPRRQPCRLVGGAGGLRAAIVSTIAGEDREPFVVTPGEVHVEQRGEGPWLREVHDVIGPRQPAHRLLLGETFSVGDGVWSGYPPHKHDRDDPPNESRLDEIFLVQVRPRSGFGILVQYGETDEREHAKVVRDGDIVTVNEGYHSFVAAGGHKFYYLWALAGEKRMLCPRTDPRHGWLQPGPREPGTAHE